ncbi:membrane protein [Rhizobium leguminosarum bv. trifolii CB782]|uniref:Probable membrane transporter protein n=2 Tax=Rhizobium TaxID=379 RepID=A0A2A6KH49_9HYPH|nr:sulfite exporter TauE/SafE family protein [Rhizobium hidalgonense]AHG45425.1 membrane protein [Rhizobium leguminosarum bv. trifolii CB782]EJC72621.1 putative permease [Rhizobium leguminosarum bv. trifolii WSM2012]MDR9771178.1 sulfite exporter TauE/SafE family protein [Rhizobium hidalgonense]MDR9803776.1 sulfite exporter TauE/SafE family protein [Rhizobium hidalgonense]MDR9809268.1 sulfite exporter TauE/SafE family protein [Rhizobium hidalgonense]
MTFEPLYSLSGLFVGALVGITGVGGGSLMTPLLVLLFGVHPATAVGTDLLYAAITKTAGTAVHGVHGRINWKIVGALAVGSVPAALLMLWLLAGVDRKSIGVTNTITTALGWLLVMTAIMLVFRGPILELARRAIGDRTPPRPAVILTLTVVLGFLLGVLVTLTSVGAGALGVTILLVLYPRLDVREIVGSDIVHAVPLTLIGGMGYWFIGEIDWPMLFALLVGSIPGIIIGSLLAPKLRERTIRIVLAVTLAVVAWKLLAS